MEKHRKLLHVIIHRMADLVVIMLILACLIFANRGLVPDMMFILVILSLVGISISISHGYKRKYSHGRDLEPSADTENHPVAQIRSVLFLDVPLEAIIMGYFMSTALLYGSKLIFEYTLPELDFAFLLLSGIMSLLLLYKLAMVIGVAKRFSWRIFLYLILSSLISGIMMSRPEVIGLPLLQAAVPSPCTCWVLFWAWVVR